MPISFLHFTTVCAVTQHERLYTVQYSLFSIFRLYASPKPQKPKVKLANTHLCLKLECTWYTNGVLLLLLLLLNIIIILYYIIDANVLLENNQ